MSNSRRCRPGWQRRAWSIAFVLSAWLAPHAFAQTPSAPAELAVQQPRAELGLLYTASREGATVFVYGTVHVGNPGFYPLGQRTLQALRHSHVLAVEVDVLDPGLGETFRRLGRVPAGRPSLQFRPEQARLIEPLLRDAGMDAAYAARIRPDILALLLTTLEAGNLGYWPAYSVDSFLLGFARALDLPVVELEGMTAQLQLNQSLGEDDQHEFLNEALGEIGDGKARKSIADLMDAWKNHDLERLEPYAVADPAGFRADYLRRQMEHRNAAMTSAIVGLAQKHRRVFVAVGVLHLLGDTGVPAALARAGFRVQRLF